MVQKKRTHNPEQTLDAAFSNRHSTSNIKRMYKIGSIGMQESAFSIYNNGNRYAASRLLVPNPLDRVISNEEDAAKRYTSIDISSLIHVDNKYSDVKDSMLSEHDKKILAGIEADEDMPEREKFDLTEIVMDRARLRSQGINDLGLRTDLAMDVHNHPVIHFVEPLFDMVTPSPQDVAMSERMRRVNPGHVSGIVGANNSDEQAMLLYGAESNRDQNVDRYDIEMNPAKSSEFNLSLLGKCGFVSAIVLMDPTGKPIDGQQDTIRDFAAQIKTT